MLPSTGLFREFQCPYLLPGNEENSAACIRPFCHFKHGKIDSDGGESSGKPKYCPTPLNSEKGELSVDEIEDIKHVNKKPKLEYIPLPKIKSRIEYNPVNSPPHTSENTQINGLPENAHQQIKPEAENKENIENKIKEDEKVNEPEVVVEQIVADEPKTEVKKDDKNSHKSRSSSSSTSRHKSSHRSKSSKDDRHRSSSKKSSSDSSRHKSTSSSRDKEKKSSSRSSSKSKSKDKDRREKEKEKEKTKDKEKHHKKSSKEKEKPKEASFSPDIGISDLESDEDDVLEQCKAIFEEYTPQTNGKVNEIESKVEEAESDSEPVDVSKKRVARDGAVKPILQVPQRNLKLNPMQQIYKRQEAMKKMVETQAASKSPSTSTSSSLPSSPMNLPPPKARPNIAPVSNMLAFKYAKEKIQALRDSQKPKIDEPAPSTSKTLAQTASKFYGRVAHVPTNKDELAKPSPPVLEPTSNKISYNIRMQYYNMMTKHCLVIYPNIEDAWNRAQIEELAVMKKCNTVNIYKSSALLTVNKLRKEAIDSGNKPEGAKLVSHDLIVAGKQNTSWSVNKKIKSEKSQVIGNFDIMPGAKAYKLVLECIATEEQLKQHGYPRGTPGNVRIYSNKPPLPPNKDERYCSRCSKVFSLEMYDEIHIDECNYHPKSAGFRRGSADNFHYCCQQPAGSPGCKYDNYHVTHYLDYDNLKGFVRTLEKPIGENEEFTKRDIFAFDCEMCYTRGGFELTRITVVNFDEKVVYDTLVKPDNEVVDYNTTYSGITEEQLKNVKTSIREVQAVLLSMFHADTILIGHSLESDLKAVKLLHDKVVDTSMLFPHKMGLPKKRSLKNLCIENLKRIIQENEAGHDSSEDAIACIQLVKHYLRNKIV